MWTIRHVISITQKKEPPVLLTAGGTLRPGFPGKRAVYLVLSATVTLTLPFFTQRRSLAWPLRGFPVRTAWLTIRMRGLTPFTWVKHIIMLSPHSDQLIIPCKLLHASVSPDENSLSFRFLFSLQDPSFTTASNGFYYTVVLSYNDRSKSGRLPFDAAAVPCQVRLQDVPSLSGSAFAGRLP